MAKPSRLWTKSERATCKCTKERYSWNIGKVAKLLYLWTKMDKEGNKRAKVVIEVLKNKPEESISTRTNLPKY